jgi:microcystin-dependent protein
MSDATTSPLYHRYIPPAEVDNYQCRRLYIPNHEQYRAAINELLSRLMLREVWDATPFTMSADDAASLAGEMLSKFWQDDCMIGTIIANARRDIPGWALPCDGSTYDAADYPGLWEVIDPNLILDASHFKTPDLRGRVIMSSGEPDHPAYSIGGEYYHALLESEMPYHAHGVPPHTHGYIGANTVTVPAGLDPAPASYVTPIPGDTLPSGWFDTVGKGGDGHHENQQPYFVIPYIIIAK